MFNKDIIRQAAMLECLETRVVLSTTVPATGDLWLAGMPSGTALGGDVAPTNSPVQASGITVAGGQTVTFSATGTVYFSGPGSDGPDGESGFIVNPNSGAQNGMSSGLLPVDALIGVFLSAAAPSATTAPASLDFSTTASQDYTTMSPDLKQVFFIGDGKTSGNVVQKIIVPPGATRLFLGTTDGEGWYDNGGQFVVTTTVSGTADGRIAITGASASASTDGTSLTDRKAAYTLTGSPDTASADGFMWQTQWTGITGESTDSHPAITYDLKTTYHNIGLKVYNYNEGGYSIYGVKTADVQVASSSSGPWTTAIAGQTFAQNTGSNIVNFTTVNLPATTTGRYVRLNILSNWNGGTYPASSQLVGLSEVELTGVAGTGTTTPAKVAVTGNGSAIANNGTQISTSNNTDFGTVAVGSVKDITYTIKNTGGTSLTLSALPSLTGANADQFKILTNPAATIAAGGSTSFTVEYIPAIDIKTSATIIFKDSDTSASTFAFAIGGTGSGFGFAEAIGPAFNGGVATDASGNIYTGGIFVGTSNFNPKGTALNLTSAGGNDAFITKYNSSGIATWARRIGGKGDESVASIATDTSGNVYAAIVFTGTVDFDPGTPVQNLSSVGKFATAIVKLTSTGTLVWAKALSGTTSTSQVRPFALAVDKSGNVVVSGAFKGPVDFDPASTTKILTGAGASNANAVGDMFVVRLTSTGALSWADAFYQNTTTATANPTADGADAFSIAVDSVGNPVVGGAFVGTIDFDPGTGTAIKTSASPHSLGFFLKLNVSTGTLAWIDVLEPDASAKSSPPIVSLATDASNNIYAAGSFAGTRDFDPSSASHTLTAKYSSDFVLKFDSSGKYVWADAIASRTTVDGTLPFDPIIRVDVAGNPSIAGSFTGIADFDPGTGTTLLTYAGPAGKLVKDGFIARLTSAGALIRAERFGSAGIDEIVRGFALTPHGDAVLVGTQDPLASTLPANDNFDPGIGTYNVPITSASVGHFLADYLASASAAILITGNSNSIPNGSAATTTTGQDFGSVTKGTTKTAHFAIKNTGTATLVFSSYAISGTNQSDFGIANFPITILAGETAQFDILFKPTALGARTATLTILSNDPLVHSFSFIVKGTGT